MSNKYQEIINLAKKDQESKKSKGRKILELQGHEFNDDGDIVVDLITETNVGKKNFGKITYDAYKAIKGNTLDSYKPKNEEEKSVLDGYKQYTGMFNPSNAQTKYEQDKFGKGNIDLTDRPIYVNPDGKISTVDSIGIEVDGKHIVIPTIVKDENGKAKRLTDNEAIEHYNKTGEYLGMFDNQKEADEYAQNLHIEQDAYYKNPNENQANLRDANLWDVTIGSVIKGYLEARHGQESWKAAQGLKNNKAYYEEKLKSDDYSFMPSGAIEEAVSGAAKILGQWGRQYTDERSLTMAATGAGMALAAGQAGPQVLAPEELLTVPGATMAGFATGSALANFDIEAGHAYNEMVEMGISPETAKSIASAVGAGNAALEMLQLDELVKGFKIVKGLDNTKGFAKKLGDFLLKKGVHIAKETTQEVGQEAVTIAGVNVGSKIDKGEWAYDWEEMRNRVGDTAVSSAISFALLGMGGDVVNSGAKIIENKKKTTTIGKDLRKDGVVEDVIVTGLESPKNSISYTLAKLLDNKGDKISDFDIGLLHLANERQINKEDKKAEKEAKKASKRNKFKDTKTGNTIEVTNRDNVKTTVEIETPKGTQTRQLTNEQFDNSVESGQVVAFNDYESEADELMHTDMTEDVETPTTTEVVAETTTDKSHTVAYTNDNEKLDFKYKVVNADDLIVSNDLDGKVNAKYPQELQPRDRSRVSSQSQIRQIANNLNPARLAESTSVSEGSPIVGNDNVVESGNGRTLAIKLAYESGTADEYKNYIINNAEKYGLDISNLPEKPILVRERVTEVNRTEFTRKANESSIGSLSATEQARVDAEKLTEDVLNLLVPNEEGIINTTANKDFISAVITRVFGNEDLNNVVNADGGLSTRGLERITNAIFYKAYGDASLSARLSESLDNDMKNATRVLLNIAPRIVSIKNDIQQGELYNFDFSEDIASAVRLFEKCRNEDLTIVEYNAQTTLFEKENPLILEMGYVFETKNRGAKQATDFYNILLDTVEGMGSPKQISLGITDVFQTKEEIFNEAVERFNNGEESTKPITIPESLSESTSEQKRDDDSRGTNEILGNELTENETIETPTGIQQDNGQSEETGSITDDEQLRQENESVEGQSEVKKPKKKTTKNKIIRAKKGDWSSHDVYWYAPNSNTVIAYSTKAGSDLIETMAEDNPKMTISELHDAINYDVEAKKVLQAYINSGFGDEIASEHFVHNKEALNNKSESDTIEEKAEETPKSDVTLTDKCTLTPTKRTDNGKDIWVISLNDRITQDEFNELRKIVKQHGGNYSRFAKSPDGKSIPGFIFNSEPTTDVIKAFNDFFKSEELSKPTKPETNLDNNLANNLDNELNNQAENDTIEEKQSKEGVKDDKPQSEVLAGESETDDRGLHSRTTESTEQETTERVDGQHRENGGETLSQSDGTDGSESDVGNDSERVHGRNDAEDVVSETERESTELTDETSETIDTEDKSIERERPSNKENFVITDDIANEFDNTLPNAKDNIEAIELLLKLESEGRQATAEEKKILAKYKGWGGVDTQRLPYELSRKLWDLYDYKTIRDMQTSMSNAFFTPTKVIDAMYNGLKRMGFKGGNILESSMGVGNFFGRMPAAISGKSALTGVELESYTARIAQYLYPGATVINKPFQDVAIRNGSYDLVIGNVPFGNEKISYNKKKYSLHNYFIISSLDKVKDGGIVAVITSASTLDSYGVDARKAIMDRADVVACYKLPAGVFSRNANTDVQTDLLIFRKRGSNEKPSGDSILDVTTTDDGLRLNEYFVKHPENVLGTLAKGTNAWGEITTVLDNGDFYDKLDNAMKNLPKDLISGKVELKPIETIVSTSSKPRFFEKNGKIYADDGAGTATEVTRNADTVRDYMAVRDAYKDLLVAYENDLSDAEIKPLREALNKAYDNFYKKHTAIQGDGKKKIGKNKSKDNRFLEADSDYYLVCGLEKYSKNDSKFEKSAVFEKDTLRKKKVTSVDTASDALAISLNETGKIDFARMSDLTGKTEKQLIEELKGEIVLTPEGDYVLTDIYLSGNIYAKLEAVKDKPEFKEQKEMLEKVLPTPKDASSIMIKLGANYIDAKHIQDFSREIFMERIEVSKDSSGTWSIEGSGRARWGDILNVKYGCDKYNAIQLLEKVLNDSEITVYDTYKDGGKTIRVYNAEMTDVAKQKAEDIKEAFENWIFKDSDRRADVVDKYNRMYNNYRPLDYGRIAEKLSFDSMDKTLKEKLYPHQKKGIARFLFGGNILFAHGVGTGKTFEMIASVMEAKRMGIVNKTAMVVPNNKVVDFKNDIAQAYPDAKVLVIDTANKKRQTMLGLVNSNDWDIVLISRTTFTKIPVSKELQENYYNEQVEELDRQIAEAQFNRNVSKRDLQKLIKSRDNLLKKLEELNSDTNRDENSVEFEKLGFDCICVDEAHNYKSVITPSKLNIKGLSKDSSSQQANDMLMKLDYMRTIDGRIVFGTGTPVTNTVSEIYNMMRMVRPDILEDAGIHSLDEWANTFANIESEVELNVDGKPKDKAIQTIRSFFNGSEMLGMYRQFADVVFTEDVVKNLPKAIHKEIVIKGTSEHKLIQDQITNAIAGAKGLEALSIYANVMSMASAAAVDLRMLSGVEGEYNPLQDYSLEELEYENSKINTMCNYVLEEYNASKDIKGTQIIFCDGGAGTGKTYTFNAHKDIMQKLIDKGIPKEEIVIVKNQKDAQLEELFDKVNSGEVRVLIGTSAKMAEGLNVQKRVVAIHHPTVTYNPADWEQSNARGIRAGNMNDEVKIYTYLQENTFDSHRWQAQQRKGEMINKALRGESVDDLEDVGDDIDATTAMAITSGNPIVKEKIAIDKEVKRLKTLKQNFMNEYYRYQDAIAKNPSEINRLSNFAQRIERDIATRNKYGEKADISIKGKTFEKQSDANKALVEAVKSAPKNGQFTKIGEYNGFDIMFKGDTGGLNYTLVVKGANEYTVEYAGSGNNIARIDGVLTRLDKELTRVQGVVERLRKDLEFAKQEVNKPFEKEKDLTEALEKQKDITYRYEHYGQTQNNTQTENEETVHSSRNDTDDSERWTTQEDTSNQTTTKLEKVKSKATEVANKVIDKVNEIPIVNIPNIENENVKIVDIVKLIKDNFDLPIATGKVTDRKATGIYKERAEAIRVRIANDLPTIFHELGHHFDKLYNLSSKDSVKKLRKAISKEFLDQYTADKKSGEAVAEFVRTYLKNTEEAKALCPEFYNDFVTTLSIDDLKTVDIIANVANEYMKSGFSERVKASIVSGNTKEQTTLSEKAKKMHADWVDGFLPIKDVVDYVEEKTGTSLSGSRNAYTLATNSLNARAIANFNTVHGFRDLNGNIVEDAKSYIECIANVDKKNLNTLDEYLVLKHSLEWIAPEHKEVTKKRVFADDTLEDVESIQRRIAEIETAYPEMIEAAENLYEYQRNILKHIVIPAGGMTEATFNSLYEKYPCYVPFYRAIGKDGAKTKGSFANQKSPLKRAKGSGELIISPLESIIRNTDKMTKFALRNQTMQVLSNYANTVDGFGKFMEKVPPDMLPHITDITRLKDKFEDALQQVVNSGEDYFAVSGLFDEIFGNSVTDFTPIANSNKKIVTVLNNGNFSYYQIHDDDLYSAIAEFTPKNLEGIFSLSHKLMQPMKMLITQNNPIFATTNLARDIGTAYKHTTLNNPLEFTKVYLSAVKEVMTKGDIYKQWQAMGGGHNSELSADLDQIKVTLRQVAQKDMSKARRLLYSILCHPIATTASINDYIESIPRVMEFMRTRETGGDLQEAIFNADDITTNFKKSGRHIKAKQTNAVIMFNNASLQGLDKTYRTLTNKNTTERNKSLLKWVLSALLMAIVQSVWNKGNDDEGYKNLSSYKKNNFYNFSVGDGMFISIPKPRETALLDSFTERTIEYVFGNDEAFYDFGGYVLDQILPPMLPTTLNPIDATHDVLGSTVLGGIADVGWNKNYMDIPIEGKYDEYLPSNERYNENTTQLAYTLGQTILARKGNLSPKKIDHLISSYTGVVGQVNKALFPMNQERRDVTIGLRNKFIADSNYSTDLLNKMYDNKDKSELEWQYDKNINNAIEYEQNSIITSYISGMNKAIKSLPADKQREGRKYLLKTLNEWNYDLSASQKDMISKLENESIDKDYIFEELPSSELSWSNNKQKFTYQMTPQEYNEYINKYLKAIDIARKNSNGNYTKAKEAAKDVMSKHKKSLTSKYQSKATKVN